MSTGSASIDPYEVLRKLRAQGRLQPLEVPKHIRLKALNLVAEGPSAIKLLRSDLIAGAPVLAINAAVSIHRHLKIPVHIWAVEDRPQNLWDWAVPYLPEPGRLILFGNEQHRQAWMDRGFSKEAMFLAAPGMVQEDSGALSIMPTIYAALLKAHAVGAKRMRIFGSDMVGQGSPFTPWNPWRPSPSVGEEVRWEKERAVMAHCQRQFARMRVIVERIQKNVDYEEIQAFQRPLVEAWRIEKEKRQAA